MCLALDGKRDLRGADLEQIAVWTLMCRMSIKRLMRLLYYLEIKWTKDEMREIIQHRHTIARLPKPIIEY